MSFIVNGILMNNINIMQIKSRGYITPTFLLFKLFLYEQCDIYIKSNSIIALNKSPSISISKLPP